MYFGIRYFADITRFRESPPCSIDDKTYADRATAEAAAKAGIPKIRLRYGPCAGYVIYDAHTAVARSADSIFARPVGNSDRHRA